MKNWFIKTNNIRALLLIPVCLACASLTTVQAETSLPLAAVEYRDFPVKRYLDATIEAVHQATLSAQTSGRITEIFVDIDDHVTN